MTSKARGLADLGNAYSDGALSNRNMIINGGFDVWQRSVSTGDLGFGYKSVDRFWTYLGTSGSIDRSTDVPDGFNYCFLWNRAAAGNLGTTVELMRQGHNPYGVLVLSLYLKGNFTGTNLTINFRNYTGGSADSTPITTKTNFENYSDWTRVTMSVDCTGITPHANNKMINVEFSSFPVGGRITGVQLELGDTATPFEHRSYGDELARCQRYYYQEDTVSHFLRSFSTSTTGAWYEDYPLPVTMRATPSWTAVLGSDVSKVNAVTINGRTAKSGYVIFTRSSSGEGYCSFNKVTADAEL